MYGSILQAIGRTPLVKLTGFMKSQKVAANMYAKLEFANPFGSVKDRAALWMVNTAERDGLLHHGSTIIEPTSGNTGIGLAGVGMVKGYRVILTMPDTMSEERRRLLQAHGAELILTPGAEGMAGSIRKAKELLAEIAGAFMPDQFANPANPQAHYESTGPEIWRDLDEQVDVFVAGVGSGGTVTGVGRYLKEQGKQVRIVAVEPAESHLLSGGKPGPHKIQGIGANFVPANFDRNVVDEILQVASEKALDTARDLACCEGILVGVSGGAAVYAAAELAMRPEFAGKNIVTLLPDSGERYMSTGLFDAKK